MPQLSRHRTDIDGLRAFAILPVLFYHADHSWMSAGYLGVDIFFVISGFLITSIILREMEDNSFSFATFYARRARRILPALVVVVVATLAAAPLFMWPWQIDELGQSAIASLLFVSNMFFLEHVGYFRPDAANFPLLHTWSLAVEEQFYLVAPLVMLGAWKTGLRGKGLFALSFFAATASFAFAQALFPRYPDTAFYFAPGRAWEIGAGAAGAVFVHYRGLREGAATRAAGMVALTLIVASVTMLQTRGNGVVEKLPLILATSLLLASKNDGLAGYILRLPVFRFVGLISFSLYLWHQPILAYSHLRWGSFPLAGNDGAILVSLLLATLTWKYIEQPFRRSRTATSVVLRRAGIVNCCAIMLAMVLAANSEVLRPVSPENADLAVSFDDRTAYVTTSYNDIRYKPFPTGTDKRNILLIGDSFSQDLYNMGIEAGFFSRYNISGYYIASGCQPYFGPENPDSFRSQNIVDRCRREADRARIKPFLETADIIIFAPKWRAWSAGRLSETIAYLEIPDDKTVIAISSKNFGPFLGLRTIQMSELSVRERIAMRVGPTEGFVAAQKNLLENSGNFYIVNLWEILSGNEPRDFPVFTEDARLISYDGNHLTKAGAQWIGARLFSYLEQNLAL